MKCWILFNWLPCYECMAHKLRLHVESGYTAELKRSMAVYVIRKQQVG
jgi:hypothetical protein